MRKIGFFIVLSVFPIWLQAVDFPTLQQYMLTHSKALKVKAFDIKIAQEDLDIANAEYYPTLAIGFSQENSRSLSDTRNQTYINGNSVSNDDLKKSYTYANLNYNIYSFGRTNNKSSMAKHDIEAKKSEYCLQKQETELKLLEAYHKTWSMQEQVFYLNQNMQAQNQLYNYNQRLYKIGNVDHLSVLKSAQEVAQTYNQLLQSKKSFYENLEEIKKITHYTFENNEELSPLRYEAKIIHSEFKDSSTAKALQQQIQSKTNEVSFYTKDLWAPKINFYAKYDGYGSSVNGHSQAFDELEKNSYKMGVTVTWELFNGFKSVSLRQKALLQLQQLNEKYTYENSVFDSEKQSLNQNIKYEKKLLQTQNKSHGLAKEMMDKSKKLSHIGELSQLQMLNAKVSELDEALKLSLNEANVIYEQIRKTILLNGEQTCTVP